MFASHLKPKDGQRPAQGTDWVNLVNPDNILRLENGNAIAFAEYGDGKGEPIIFCHGWPSSCTMAELTDRAAREVGARIISPDRPGISGSTLQQDRKLADWPPIAQRLADHLGLKQFRMLAISGGPPYAYATAWAMPERVRALAVVSGAPPIVDLSEHSGLLPLYRWMLVLYRRSPQLLRIGFHLARPIASVRMSMRLAQSFLGFLQPCDADALRDATAFNACFESQRRGRRGGGQGGFVGAQSFPQALGVAFGGVD